MILRLAEPADCAQVANIYGFYVRVTPISFELEPPDAVEVQRRMDHYAEIGPWLVVDHEGEILGYAYAAPFRTRPAYRWTAEVSVYVKQGMTGRGLGIALYSSLLACLKLQGLVTVIGGITLPNESSVRLHEKLGFVKCAHLHNVGYKFAKWHDVGFWEITLNPAKGVMPEVRKPAEIAMSAEWQAAVSAGERFIKKVS